MVPWFIGHFEVLIILLIFGFSNRHHSLHHVIFPDHVGWLFILIKFQNFDFRPNCWHLLAISRPLSLDSPCNWAQKWWSNFSLSSNFRYTAYYTFNPKTLKHRVDHLSNLYKCFFRPRVLSKDKDYILYNSPSAVIFGAVTALNAEKKRFYSPG